MKYSLQATLHIFICVQMVYTLSMDGIAVAGYFGIKDILEKYFIWFDSITVLVPLALNQPAAFLSIILRQCRTRILRLVIERLLVQIQLSRVCDIAQQDRALNVPCSLFSATKVPQLSRQSIWLLTRMSKVRALSGSPQTIVQMDGYFDDIGQ